MRKALKFLAILVWSSWLPAEGAADPLGAADAAELAKLTEIITQMTELLDKTQQYLDVQRRMTAMQERTFFRKAQAYGREMRQLVYKQELLERKAREFREDPLHLEDMLKDIQEIRRHAAQTDDGATKENLLQLADTLDLMGNTGWLVGTARTALEEMANSSHSNTQDQLMAGILHTLIGLRKTIDQGEMNENIKEMNARWRMQGAYSVFKEDYEN